MKVKFLILLSLVAGEITAQTLLTGIVTDSLSKPIPGVSVYLSKTTMGTLTDQNGSYSLSIPRNGTFELAVTSVGYRTEMRIISIESQNQTMNFRLSIKYNLLDDVSVVEQNRNRRKFFNQFAREFIGQTYNSKSCQILNPQDLQVFRDPKTGMIKAYSYKPLRIENKYLGYTLIYDLLDFGYNTKTHSLKYSGYNYFLPADGSDNRKEKWKLNRLTAFYGSKMHFLRSLFKDSLSNEGYQIFRCEYDTLTKAYRSTIPVKREEIFLSDHNNYSRLDFNEPVMIRYTNKHPEIRAGKSKDISHSMNMIMSYNADFEIRDPDKPLETIIFFSDTLNLYRSGYFHDPYSVTWRGEMAEERVGEALPFNYTPDSDVLKMSSRRDRKSTRTVKNNLSD